MKKFPFAKIVRKYPCLHVQPTLHEFSALQGPRVVQQVYLVNGKKALKFFNLLLFQIPFAAFTKLSKEYGNVFSMKLGSSWCVIVNDPKSVKEVLITKGAHFDARPTLKRFDLLFGGDKENCKFFASCSSALKSLVMDLLS